MTLVDTSVWIDHLRKSDANLATLLEEGRVLVHPFVIGEIACGSLRWRADVLGHLRRLPHAPLASDEEVHHLLDTHALAGRGLGWVDVHLLASSRIGRCRLLTHDRRLREVVASLP